MNGLLGAGKAVAILSISSTRPRLMDWRITKSVTTIGFHVLRNELTLRCRTTKWRAFEIFTRKSSIHSGPVCGFGIYCVARNVLGEQVGERYVEKVSSEWRIDIRACKDTTVSLR